MSERYEVADSEEYDDLVGELVELRESVCEAQKTARAAHRHAADLQATIDRVRKLADALEGIESEHPDWWDHGDAQRAAEVIRKALNGDTDA